MFHLTFVSFSILQYFKWVFISVAVFSILSHLSHSNLFSRMSYVWYERFMSGMCSVSMILVVVYRCFPFDGHFVTGIEKMIECALIEIFIFFVK